MRSPLVIPSHLIAEAKLYAPSRDSLDAVCFVLSDYPNLVSEVRNLRRRLSEFDREAIDFDCRLTLLQDACRQILDL